MSNSGESSQVGEAMHDLSLEEVPTKVTLRSSDGEAFEVEETVILESDLIKNLIEGGLSYEEIPLDNINSTILAKVIEYCGKHAGGKYDRKDEELKKWDSMFIDEVDLSALYHLFLGSNYMSVKGLLDLCAERVADMIKGKSVEQIRKAFNIVSDFTPEQEKAIREKNAWAFE